MIIGIDTHVLIWGHRDWPPRVGATERDVEMQKRARILIRQLSDQQNMILVSNVTVAELLCRVEKSMHGNYISMLEKRFFLKTLDLRAVSLAADLWMRYRALPGQPSTGAALVRDTLRSDCPIVATAKAGGASRFYSNDKGS